MLDFSRAALAAKAEPVPAGTYDLKITDAETSTSGSGHTLLAIAGEVVDDPQKGRAITDSLMLASVDEQRLAGLIRRGLQMLKQLLEAVDASDEQREAASRDLMQLGRLLKGRTVRVTTGVNNDQRDGTRREIVVKVQPSPLDQISGKATMLVTFARAASGVATKRHRLGPAGEVVTEGYPDGESRWALYRRDLPDLLALASAMREIPMDTCLLRGQPAPFVPPGSLTRRRLGETLLDRPTDLIVYDIDNLLMAACLDPITDPLDAALYAVSRLPDEHQDRSFAYAHSASAGFSRDKLKLKLFFQASEPLESETARTYQKGVNEAAGFKLLDPCITSATQPIYVAAPICEPPLRDPLNGRRYGFWQGLEERVTLDLKRCIVARPAAGSTLGTGWRRHLAAIGTEAGFRDPIVRTVCTAVAEAGGMPEDLDVLMEEIATAVLSADPGDRDRRTIERYASAAHTRDIALWAARQQARQATQVERLRAEIFRTKP